MNEEEEKKDKWDEKESENEEEEREVEKEREKEGKKRKRGIEGGRKGIVGRRTRSRECRERRLRKRKES